MDTRDNRPRNGWQQAGPRGNTRPHEHQVARGDQQKKNNPNQPQYCPIPADTFSLLVTEKRVSCGDESVENRGHKISNCSTRSLVFDRFTNPLLKENARRVFYDNHRSLKDKNTADMLRKRRLDFLRSLAGASTIEMELRSRLVVNASGGVMENAGMCLDRFSNLPYIPGSAVKGCARRTALYYLHEWVTTGNKPEGLADAPNYNSPDKLFQDLALMFGWVDQDWKDDEDFAWAWGKLWAEKKRNTMASELLVLLGMPVQDEKNPWRDLPAFEGTVGFLSAWPQHSPTNDIELDVITCHHMEYYNGDRDMATDDEDPNPVVFPAVAAGHVFVFGLYPVGRARPLAIKADDLVVKAKAWLKLGLELFGVGGKTAAGYGWFGTPARSGGSTTGTTVSFGAVGGVFGEADIKNLIKQADAGPGQWNKDFIERVKRLQEPENEAAKKRFLEATKDNKELRKQPWYPK